MKENVNMNIDKSLVKKAKKEAQETRRTFSGFIEHLLDRYFSGKGKNG